MDAGPLTQLHGDEFDPYVDNGGTCLAIAGPDFVLIGADTRLGDGGYGILSREAQKTHVINERVLMTTSGMRADAEFLLKTLRADCEDYEAKTAREIGVGAFARLLSVTLYRRRFFPWYTFNIVAGLDAAGAGRVYAYDAVGSSGSYQYAAAGSGGALALPVLDAELMPLVSEGRLAELTPERACRLAERAMAAVAEREIGTGDDFVYYLLGPAGLARRTFGLRRD